MNQALRQEVNGRAPVFVVLAGESYPLEYPIHAVILYKSLSGDNLFDGECWKKIAPIEDPARFLACLYAGMHRYDEETGKWVAPLTRTQLERVIDFSNVTPVCEAITRALASYFPKAGVESSPPGESPLPKDPGAASSDPASPSSGPSPATTSS